MIADEIYALTIFGKGAKFESVLSMDNIPNKDKVHVIWGFSKVRDNVNLEDLWLEIFLVSEHGLLINFGPLRLFAHSQTDA